MANLRQVLYAWRDQEAAKRAVELFRILPGSTLDDIVKVLPKTKEELIAIKGIKEAKYQLYGKAILALVEEYSGAPVPQKRKTESDHVTSLGSMLNIPKQEERVFSVGAYLDIVNNALWRIAARVQGEITSLKFQGGAVYMSIKDAKDDGTMRVFMWRSDFEASGVEVCEGMDVIVEGKSEIYKPSGGFSFRAQTIELVGEGALKAAYDALKKKLESEGLFADERKRALPDFPERVGLITSREGAVIHDFLNNLGRFGFRITFTDSRVEGVAAVKELLAAITRIKKQSIDVLVVVRGGGSLESLQAFNNEHVVRALASFPKPVICAIGHDKDVPLAQLVADFAPSTPTACTALLNTPWEEVAGLLRLSERDLISGMQSMIRTTDADLVALRSVISDQLMALRDLFRMAEQGMLVYIPMFARALDGALRQGRDEFATLTIRYANTLVQCRENLDRFAEVLRLHDPLRQLRLGYSILSDRGKVLRSVSDLANGGDFEARLSDGTLKATVTEITRE